MHHKRHVGPFLVVYRFLLTRQKKSPLPCVGSKTKGDGDEGIPLERVLAGRDYITEYKRGQNLTFGSGSSTIYVVVLDGEVAAPCTRNPL